MLLRGVSASGGRGTMAADLLRRMPLIRPSPLLGVLCALRLLTFATAAAAALLPLIRDREFLPRRTSSVSDIPSCYSAVGNLRSHSWSELFSRVHKDRP